MAADGDEGCAVDGEASTTILWPGEGTMVERGGEVRSMSGGCWDLIGGWWRQKRGQRRQAVVSKEVAEGVGAWIW